MRKKSLLISMVLTLSIGLVLACEKQPQVNMTPESKITGSAIIPEDTEKEQSILEESFEARREAAESYVKASEKTVEEIGSLIDQWKNEAEKMDDDARQEVEKKIEDVSSKRDITVGLLDNMKEELSKLSNEITYGDADAVTGLEEAYYSAFLRNKKDVDAAMTALQNAYYEAFLK